MVYLSFTTKACFLSKNDGRFDRESVTDLKTLKTEYDLDIERVKHDFYKTKSFRSVRTEHSDGKDQEHFVD